MIHFKYFSEKLTNFNSGWKQIESRIKLSSFLNWIHGINSCKSTSGSKLPFKQCHNPYWHWDSRSEKKIVGFGREEKENQFHLVYLEFFIFNKSSYIKYHCRITANIYLHCLRLREEKNWASYHEIYFLKAFLTRTSLLQ